MFDVVIKNGRVFDGTGAASRVCNLGIRDGLVAELSDRPLDETGARVIDAAQCWVTPGFIDTHTHYDAELIVAPSLSSASRTAVLVRLGALSHRGPGCGVATNKRPVKSGAIARSEAANSTHSYCSRPGWPTIRILKSWRGA